MNWRDVPGFFDFEAFYAEVAEQLPQGAVAVEVGVYMGRSLSFLASRLRELGKAVELWGVDIWDDRAVGNEPEGEKVRALSAPFGGNLYATFLNGLREQGLSEVRHLREKSWEAAKAFHDASVDFVFIDAAHDRESVQRDLRAWLPKLKPGGILAGHDYGHPLCREVAEVIDKTFGAHVETRPGYVWLVRPEMLPLVSVITATHARPRQLRRAVDSVIAQTYPRIEHVIVADGPQADGVRSVAHEHPQVRYLELGRNWHELTGGIDWGATPRFVGTCNATGSYLAFLDDDNIFLPTHIEKLMEVVRTSGADFGWSQLSQFRGLDGEGVGLIGDGTLRVGGIDTSVILARAELFGAANWRTSGYEADWDLITRWISAGAKHVFLPQTTVHYDLQRRDKEGTPTNRHVRSTATY